MSPVSSERPSSEKDGGLFISERFFGLGALILFAIILSLYSVSLGHNFLFDEENIILRNPLIRSFSLVPELFRHGYFYFEGRAIDWQQYYRPLTSLTFTLDHFIWKFNPLGYNLTNVFLHVAVSVLFFRLLMRIFKRQWPAFLSALLWSVHTIHTEAVTYTASRGDLLGALLMLAVFLLYWNRRSVIALVIYGIALFSKESLILLPLSLAAFDLVFTHGGARKALARLTPFFAFAAVFFVFRKFFSPVPLGPPSDDLAGAALRVLSMGGAFTSYLQALLFPEAFKFCKSISFASNFLSGMVFQTLLVAGLLAAGWLAAYRRRGAAFFGMSVFLVGLIPYSQVIHFYPEWAEHYLYIPSMGLAILLGCAIAQLPKTLPARTFLALLAVYAAFFGFLCYRTWQRNVFYKDTEKYYQRLAVSDSPYAYYGYQNLARLLIEDGKWDEAIVPLKTAFSIEPNSDVTHNLLGLTYLQFKQLPEAIAHFQEAFRLSGDLKYLTNAGTALIRMEAYSEAIKMFERIQRSSPRQISVYTNLVAACELSGDAQKALQWGEAGLVELRANQEESVVLLMALARLSYRQGWADLLREKLDLILTRYGDSFWYGDLAKLWAGKMTPDEFLEKVRAQYPGFESTSKVSLMAYYVLHGEAASAARFYKENEVVLEDQAAGHPLVEREMRKAREAFSGKPSI